MLETEIKLRLVDAAVFRSLLIEHGWKPDPQVFERNTVFDTQTGELLNSGRLLRIRQINDRAIVTVKLPAVYNGPHKVREEHQFETNDVEQARQVFLGLGYEQSWIYEKRRTTFRKDGEQGIIEVDETPIGDYTEMEGEAAWIDQTAAALGFSKADYLVDTYRTLFEAWLERTGSDVIHMTFD
jgi:predicted adenylyl cyclase CyaB